jgi:hypothetical protein
MFIATIGIMNLNGIQRLVPYLHGYISTESRAWTAIKEKGGDIDEQT